MHGKAGLRVEGKSDPTTLNAFAYLPLDALRAYQKQQLCDNFDMIELSVFRDKISKSFKHQVLAT